MTDAELEAIEKAWVGDRIGTHWDGCHMVAHHHGCAVAKLLAEVRRLRAQLERIRQMTGQVRHTDDQVAECSGCGCISATAEECVAYMKAAHAHEVELLKQERGYLLTEVDELQAENTDLKATLADWAER